MQKKEPTRALFYFPKEKTAEVGGYLIYGSQVSPLRGYSAISPGWKAPLL